MNLLYFLIILFASCVIVHIIIVPLVEFLLVSPALFFQRRLNKSNTNWIMLLIYTPSFAVISYLYVLGHSTVLYFTIDNFSALWIKILLSLFSVGIFSGFIERKIRFEEIRAHTNSFNNINYSSDIFEFYSYLRLGISCVILTTILILIWPESFSSIFKWPYVILCSYW